MVDDLKLWLDKFDDFIRAIPIPPGATSLAWFCVGLFFLLIITLTLLVGAIERERNR